MSIHRLEILAGSVRRRKFTQAAKEAIVSETLRGEASVTDIARRHDLDRSLVCPWRRELGVVEKVEAAIGFVPVNVAAGVPVLLDANIFGQIPGAIEIHVGMAGAFGWERALIRPPCLVSLMCWRRDDSD